MSIGEAAGQTPAENIIGNSGPAADGSGGQIGDPVPEIPFQSFETSQVGEADGLTVEDIAATDPQEVSGKWGKEEYKKAAIVVGAAAVGLLAAYGAYRKFGSKKGMWLSVMEDRHAPGFVSIVSVADEAGEKDGFAISLPTTDQASKLGEKGKRLFAMLGQKRNNRVVYPENGGDQEAEFGNTIFIGAKLVQKMAAMAA